jgi:hypothetical protein
MKALLNDEGKKIWGYAFPDGEIPVKNAVAFKAEAVGSAGPLKDKAVFDAYLVDWDKLNTVQKQKILQHFKERFNGSPQEVLAQLEKNGLPLRASLVSCVSILARYF